MTEPRAAATVDRGRMLAARPSRKLLAKCQQLADTFRTLVPWPALAVSWQADADRVRAQLEQQRGPHRKAGLRNRQPDGYDDRKGEQP